MDIEDNWELVKRNGKVPFYVSDPTEEELIGYKLHCDKLMKYLISEYDESDCVKLDGTEFHILPEKFKNISRDYALSKDLYEKFLQIYNEVVFFHKLTIF